MTRCQARVNCTQETVDTQVQRLQHSVRDALQLHRNTNNVSFRLCIRDKIKMESIKIPIKVVENGEWGDDGRIMTT